MSNTNWVKLINMNAGRHEADRALHSNAAASAVTEDDLEAYRFRGVPVHRLVSHHGDGSPGAPGEPNESTQAINEAARNNSALQPAPPSSKPGRGTTVLAGASHGQTTLTPAAPVSSKVPASSEEDIRTIRQPRHIPTLPPWAAAAAGVITLAAAAFALWKWTQRV